MKRKIIYYNPKLKDLARKLRKNSTLSEIILWKHLKGKQIQGYRFSRQKPINNYIVDFYCFDLMLIIEIDGISHYNNYDKDKIRQQKLEKLGLTMLRFSEGDIRNNLEGVLMTINNWIKKHTPPYQAPL